MIMNVSYFKRLDGLWWCLGSGGFRNESEEIDKYDQLVDEGTNEDMCLTQNIKDLDIHSIDYGPPHAVSEHCKIRSWIQAHQTN